MTTVAQTAPLAPTFGTSNEKHIASLSPSSIDPSSYVIAQVALVWPYSSSTGSLALLLADTDIRRRKSKGQVKVVFHHGCAREVANTKVGIGDVVKLALFGCEWTETGDVVSTPGKKIDWDLGYRSRVILQVLRDGQEASTVDYTRDEADHPLPNGASVLRNGVSVGRPLLNGVLHRQASTIHVPYLTPQKSHRNFSAGTFIDAALDYLVEDDGFVLGRGRKRTKFARNSGAWSLVDSEEEEPTDVLEPELENGGHEQYQRKEQQEVHANTADQGEYGMLHDNAEDAATEVVPPDDAGTGDDITNSAPPADQTQLPPTIQPVAMAAPQTPLRAPHLQLAPDGADDDADSDATITPRLHPIRSPGLPLVSPFLQHGGEEIGYFPPF